MSLSRLPDDILLEIAKSLRRETLVSFSQSFRKAYMLSLNSASWWYNDVAGSHLEEILPLEQYTALQLRNAAVMAHQTWLRLLDPQATKRHRVQAPIDNNHYGGCIPPDSHWLFYAVLADDLKTTRIICRDLRDGSVVGSYALPPFRKVGIRTYSLTATVTRTNAVQLALLCEEPDWFTPTLRVLRIHFTQRTTKSETGSWVDSEFQELLNLGLPKDGKKPQNSAIRLPRWFFIRDGLVCWLQDAVQVYVHRTLVASLLTVVKFKQTASGDIAYKIGRWTSGNGYNLQALNAIVADEFIVIATHPASPRLLPISIDEIFSNIFDPSDIERQMDETTLRKVFPLPDCQPDGTHLGFRLEFDRDGAEVVSLSDTDLPLNLQPGSFSRVLKLSLTVLGTMSARHTTSGSFKQYSVFIHTSLTQNSEFPKALLHIRAGTRESRYNIYPADFGMFRGAVWFTTLDINPVLFMSKDGDQWPLTKSTTGRIDLVDLQAGVVCCFSDSIRLDDVDPKMDITWLRDLSFKFME